MSEKRSWLEGPQIPGENESLEDAQTGWPGRSLGLAASGPGSIASLGSRLLALLIDWIVCYAMAWLFVGQTHILGNEATVTMIFFILWRIVTEWLFAQTPGHAVVGIGVARIDDPDARVGLWRAAVRSVLTIFLFPPIIQDTDNRGMHDRATGTAVIRTR